MLTKEKFYEPKCKQLVLVTTKKNTLLSFSAPCRHSSMKHGIISWTLMLSNTPANIYKQTDQ